MSQQPPEIALPSPSQRMAERYPGIADGHPVYLRRHQSRFDRYVRDLLEGDRFSRRIEIAIVIGLVTLAAMVSMGAFAAAGVLLALGTIAATLISRWNRRKRLAGRQWVAQLSTNDKQDLVRAANEVLGEVTAQMEGLSILPSADKQLAIEALERSFKRKMVNVLSDDLPTCEKGVISLFASRGSGALSLDTRVERAEIDINELCAKRRKESARKAQMRELDSVLTAKPGAATR